MQDYSTAAPQQDRDLVPDGTLAFAILRIRQFNPPNAPPGNAEWETPSKTPGNKYLDCELTICEGPFAKRKVFNLINTVNSNQTARDIGASEIRSILEVGRNANVSSNRAGYQIQHYGELDGLKVAVEVGVERGGPDGKGGNYPDKNRVRAFLTPNVESSLHKKFGALLQWAQSGYAADKAPAGKGGAAKTPAQQSAPAWAQGSTQGAQADNAGASSGPVPNQQPATTTKPAWLN